jgi:heme-degrading monooxygenase HmoA
VTKHFLLLYDSCDNFVARRAAFRRVHLEHAWDAQERGELLLAGTLAELVDGAVILFQVDSPEVVERSAHGEIMIVRCWKGVARIDFAEDYQRHVLTCVFPKLQAIHGYIGGRVMRRDVNAGVEFLVETEWISLDAIRAFAGNELDHAVVEPAAQATLRSFDHHVDHFQVVEDSSSRRLSGA